MAKRMEVKVLGRILGTANGWDGDGSEVFWFDDFKPKEDIPIKPCDSLQVDLINGWMGESDPNDENIIDPIDICQFLANIPRKED